MNNQPNACQYHIWKLLLPNKNLIKKPQRIKKSSKILCPKWKILYLSAQNKSWNNELLFNYLLEHFMHVSETQPYMNNIMLPFLKDMNQESFEDTPEGPQQEVRKAHHQRCGLKQLR